MIQHRLNLTMSLKNIIEFNFEALDERLLSDEEIYCLNYFE